MLVGGRGAAGVAAFDLPCGVFDHGIRSRHRAQGRVLYDVPRHEATTFYMYRITVCVTVQLLTVHRARGQRRHIDVVSD